MTSCFPWITQHASCLSFQLGFVRKSNGLFKKLIFFIENYFSINSFHKLHFPPPNITALLQHELWFRLAIKDLRYCKYMHNLHSPLELLLLKVVVYGIKSNDVFKFRIRFFFYKICILYYTVTFSIKYWGPY